MLKHWPGFESIKGLIALYVSFTGGDQFMFVVNVRKRIDQMSTLVRIDIWNRELPVLLSTLSQAVIVTHQPGTRGWDMEENHDSFD